VPEKSHAFAAGNVLLSAEAAKATLQDSDCELTGIWTTHHHWDHAGGNAALCKDYPGLQVLAPADSQPIAGVTREVGHGDSLYMHSSLPAVGRALHAGVHTAGHAMYLLRPADGVVHAHGVSASTALFAGDVLFPQGAGRFFEGSAGGFWDTVRRSLLPLAGDCLVFTGHDYSRGNAAFAAAAGLRRLAWEGQGRLPPSVTRLGVEGGHNPFLLPMAIPVLEAVAAHAKGAHGNGATPSLEAALGTLHALGFRPDTTAPPRQLWGAWQEQVRSMGEEENAAAVAVIAYLREWKNAL